jgi:hypothetical protein
MAVQPFGPWPLFQFLDPIHSRQTLWTGHQTVARPLPTHRKTQTQNKRTQTSMARVGFEPTTTVFGRAKTVHGLDRAATLCIRCRDNFYTESLTSNDCVIHVWTQKVTGENYEVHRCDGSGAIIRITAFTKTGSGIQNK